MHITIQQPETAEEFKHYYHLRWKLLREPWKQDEGSEVDDIEDQCFHIMAVTDNDATGNKNIVAVARLQFNSASEAQIRYMAVAPAYERQGIGRSLIEAMETHSKAASRNKIMLDAREPAVNFYQNLGYTITKKSYLLFDEIQHYEMRKDI